jgi:hypothetical protein
VRLAFGALFIKQRPGLTDEETMGQIRENAYMQFFLGFAGYSSKAPFDPSMIVHSRKRFLEEDLMRINELIVERGKAMVMGVVSPHPEVEGSDDPNAGPGNQMPIDASCTPVDITYPTDLKLLTDAREVTERTIDDLCGHHSGLRMHKPRYIRGRARASFLIVASRKSYAAAQ